MVMALHFQARCRPVLCSPWSFVPVGFLLVATSLGCAQTSDEPPTQPDAQTGADGVALPPLLDGGGGIPEAPYGPDYCPSGSCNYQSQQGCNADAGSGQACQPIPNQDGGVSPACARAGSKGSGSACSSWVDCAPGLLCVTFTCRTLCCGADYTTCPAGEHCFTKLDVQVGDAAVPSGAMVCMPAGNCDVLEPSSCPQGQACHIVDPTGAAACILDGTGKSGQACPCAVGFTCVAQSCRKLCRAVPGGGEPSCSIEEGRCVHFDRDPPGVGECAPVS